MIIDTRKHKKDQPAPGLRTDGRWVFTYKDKEGNVGELAIEANCRQDAISWFEADYPDHYWYATTLKENIYE